jgi:DNA gyrase/topoisomerase IV subunit A
MAMTTKDDDWIEHLFVASAHDYVLFFTSVGKVYRVKAWELPRRAVSPAAARSSTSCRSSRASA